ncbi:hypothetical protein [Microbacterium sp. NPDC056052]|uniref:hypothetical protein n=1 Tax=Microbacterium sp. NPDC056052 TaxID=3345695 RepID=UPI0035DECD6A
MKNKKSVVYSTLSLFVCGVIFTPALSAAADDSPLDIYDSNAVVQELSPEITSETAQVTDSALAPVRSGVKGPDLVIDPQRVESAASGRVAPGATKLSTTPVITITPTYVTDKVSNSNGMSVWRTDSDSAAAYVQPLRNGVRVLTAISTPEASRTYDYKLSVPSGTTLRENSVGYMLIGPTGASLGQLLSPWAKDANGAKLQTSYSLSGDTLTQIVDLDRKDIAYPVLIDPAWSYSHTALIENKTPSGIRSKLMNCFNCYFPVEGAPKYFPSLDQDLPLVVRPYAGSGVIWNFHCIMQTTNYFTDGNKSWFGYYFRAAADHVDGEGSTISFDFNPRWDAGNPDYIYSELVVTGWIKNDDPVALGQPAYVLAASATWNNFAHNLYYA